MMPKRSLLVFIAVMSICASGHVHAGASDAFSRVAGWWSARTIGYSSSVNRGPAAAGDVKSDAKEKGDDGDQQPKKIGEAGLPGMCKVPQQPSVMRCEIGSGFLCVDTPPGGVKDDRVRIRGTIDRQGSVLASIRIGVQNDYTKKVEYVDVSSPMKDGCWDESSKDSSYCIDGKGRFSARVPLSGPGPQTISVSASRLSGDSVEKRVRTSRVVAIKMGEENIAFDPDVKKSSSIDDSVVMVEVNLIGDCNYCDFIGASTGGVFVTVENSIAPSNGAVKKVSCTTTVEQGAQGRFVVGIPALPGGNTLSVKACNAASEPDCPTIGGISFTASGEVASLKIISPPPQPVYDRDEYPSIQWKFQISGAPECVDLRFNREEASEICSDAGGMFAAELSPRTGINVATLAIPDSVDQFSWTFGWGRSVSPFAGGDGSVGVDGALRMVISDDALRDKLIPFMNNFFASDEFSSFAMLLLGRMMGPADEKPAEAPEPEATIPPAIPKCDAGGSLGGYAMSPDGLPKVGLISLSDFAIGEDGLRLSANVGGLSIGIALAPDDDKDGKGDKDPLPLRISFKKAKFDFVLAKAKGEDGGDLFLLTSDHTDCSYKGDYCKKMPSPLVPANFEGDATPEGRFVRCDVDSAGPDAVEACRAINSLDAQTAVVAEMVLDAINSAAYCKGSAILSGLVRDRMPLSVALGCEGVECTSGISKILPRMTLPLGLGLGGVPEFSSLGVEALFSVSAGDAAFFDSTPAEYHVPSVGLAAGDVASHSSMTTAKLGNRDVGASLALDAVNAVLYAASAHGDGYKERGLLDFDIHELFFNEMGFDFVKECDGFEAIPGIKDKPPTLCYVRPQVAGLLGSALTSYGYFPAKQPLIMAIRGSRAIAPRIAVVDLDDIPVVPIVGDKISQASDGDVPTGSLVELQVGGVLLSFYAIEVDGAKPVDDYGNLPIKFDANGRPVIHSMRPDDPDPWNGPIVSFDVTLLLAIEVMGPEPAPEGEEGSVMRIRTLADRSRLIVTPIEESNVTTIPSRKLISNLAEQLMTTISQMSSKEGAMSVKVPNEIELGAGDPGSLFSKFGLRKISMGEDGLSFEFDSDENSVGILLKAVIEQVLHVGGEEVKFTLPGPASES